MFWVVLGEPPKTSACLNTKNRNIPLGWGIPIELFYTVLPIDCILILVIINITKPIMMLWSRIFIWYTYDHIQAICIIMYHNVSHHLWSVYMYLDLLYVYKSPYMIYGNRVIILRTLEDGGPLQQTPGTPESAPARTFSCRCGAPKLGLSYQILAVNICWFHRI